MADVKWIKLTVNVFDDEKFDAIKTLPDKNDIQLAWVKLLCLAGTCNENGFLMLTKEIPYTNEMLAKRFDMDIGTIQRAMSIFQRLNMIEIVDDVYMVSNWLKHQSGNRLEELRESNRERQKRFREKQKLLPEENSNVTRNVTNNVTPSYSNIYSYSSHLNVDNLQHILTNSIFKDTNYIKDNISLLNSIREWMEYKDAKKPASQHHYDTEQGICKLLTRIVNFAKANGIDAMVDAIDYSIGNNYQGIVFEVRKQNKPTRSERQRDAFDEFLRGGDG